MNNNPRIADLHSEDLELEQHSFNTMLFTDSNTGYIAGSFDSVRSNPDTNSPQFAFLDQKAVLYNTADGGRTWHENQLGDGSVMNIVNLDGVLFAVKTTKDSSGHEAYVMVKGQGWVKNETFPRWAEDITSQEHMLIATGNGNDGVHPQVSFSGDGSKTWSAPVALAHRIYSRPVVNNGSLYYLSDSKLGKTNFPQLLIRYDLEKRQEKIIDLPGTFEAHLVAAANRQVKLAGTENSILTVYALQDDKPVRAFAWGEVKNVYPAGFYCTPTENWFVLNKEGDVEKLLVKTSDGSQWETVPLNNKQWIQPFCFLQEAGHVRAWFYSGPGRLQVMN